MMLTFSRTPRTHLVVRVVGVGCGGGDGGRSHTGGLSRLEREGEEGL
jgi:hypothetical protein